MYAVCFSKQIISRLLIIYNNSIHRDSGLRDIELHRLLSLKLFSLSHRPRSRVYDSILLEA